MANVDTQANQPPHHEQFAPRRPQVFVANAQSAARVPENMVQREALATDIRSGTWARMLEMAHQVSISATTQEKIAKAKEVFALAGGLASLSAHARIRDMHLRKTFELEPYDSWFAEWRARHYTEAEIRTGVDRLIRQGQFVAHARAALGAGAT